MRSSVPSRETMKMFMMCRKQLQNQMIFFPSRQGKHGDVGKNMPTNTNVTPQATPHTESCSPIFDATPQIKSPGGVQQAAETDLPDNGPCFDQTPSEHVSVETDPATNTPQVDQISLDSEMQTVLALREYLCDTQSDTSSHYSTLRNRNDIVGTLNLLMNLYCTLLDNALPETDEMDKCKAVTIIFHFTNIIYFKWYISHCYALSFTLFIFMLFFTRSDHGSHGKQGALDIVCCQYSQEVHSYFRFQSIWGNTWWYYMEGISFCPIGFRWQKVTMS
eukprot:XP_020406174.1 uncharacterized protein LOC103651580 isoform X2 [Zea mays]